MTIFQGQTTWESDSSLCGLYVLHVDGVPTASTALVDRNRSRTEQISSLAQIAWPPPQQLTSVFNVISEAKEVDYPFESIVDGRKITPLHGGFDATIDGDEEPSSHPIRRYLFPELESKGPLALDPGEQVLATWRSFTPDIRQRRTQDETSPGRGPTHVPRELRDYTCVLTNHRLVFHGRLDLGGARKGDYPSIFLPTVLFESIAAYRQIKRWSHRPNLHWGFHLRHEWITTLGFGNVPGKRRPLLSTIADDTLYIHAALNFPNGDLAVFRLPFKRSELSHIEVASMYFEAVTNVRPNAPASGPIETPFRVPSSRPGHYVQHAMTNWEIEEAYPWSLPSSMAGGAQLEPSDTKTPPAGWYPDPEGKASLRWFDGMRWTEHTHTG